jgi:hypothetical protein
MRGHLIIEKKNWFEKHCVLTQTFLIGLISILLGEVTLRIYNYIHPTYIFYKDNYNRFRGRPFADDWDFKLNSRGFKDVEFETASKGAYRILGLGDSFAFGVVPYKYNYYTLLESQFNKGTNNKQIEVFNMGIPHTGPREQLSLLAREGLPFNPQMVIVSFFVGNDFVDSHRASERKSIYSYSYVASALRYICAIRPKFKGNAPHAQGDYRDDGPSLDHDTFLKIERDRSFIFIAGNERFLRLLDDASYYLQQIQAICSKKGIQFLVVIIPDELQVNSDLQTEVRTAFYPNLKSEQWNTTLPNRLLAEKLSRAGIECLDLFEAFEKESKHKPLYRKYDTHWNIAGNQFASDLIRDYLHKKLR